MRDPGGECVGLFYPDLASNVEGYVFGDDDLTVTALDPTTGTVASPAPDPILPLRLSFIEMVTSEVGDAERTREPIGTFARRCSTSSRIRSGESVGMAS